METPTGAWFGRADRAPHASRRLPSLRLHRFPAPVPPRRRDAGCRVGTGRHQCLHQKRDTWPAPGRQGTRGVRAAVKAVHASVLLAVAVTLGRCVPGRGPRRCGAMDRASSDATVRGPAEVRSIVPHLPRRPSLTPTPGRRRCRAAVASSGRLPALSMYAAGPLRPVLCRGGGPTTRGQPCGLTWTLCVEGRIRAKGST